MLAARPSDIVASMPADGALEGCAVAIEVFRGNSAMVVKGAMVINED
jgi:hypothetical protein